MGILSGSISLTRYNVAVLPEELDFEPATFREIAAGSEVRESAGFVPFEPGAPYQVGERRYAFRVRIDRLKPDTTAVRERLKELVQTEMEATGLPYVGSKKKKQLRELAEEELIVRTTPRSKIIEACIDGDQLHIASTAKAYLGIVLQQLRKIGVIAEVKTPWIDRGEPEVESEFVATHEPGESILGCRFLKALIGDSEILVEPEAGNVRLQTIRARVTLSGEVLGDLHRYIERGAEILSAKLVTSEGGFRFEAASYRLASLRIETGRHDHWTELLDERLEKISAVWDLLDRKYALLASRLGS